MRSSAMVALALGAALLAGCASTATPDAAPTPTGGLATTAQPQPGETGGAPQDTATPAPTGTGVAATPTDQPTDASTPPPTAAPPPPGGPDPGAVGDLVIHPQQPHCDFVPHGMLDGSDEVSVSVHIDWTSITLPSRLVPVRATTTSGDSVLFNTAVDPTPDVLTAIQFTPRPGDFGTTLQITITLDPDNVIPETDPDDNIAYVSFYLPSPRPVQALVDQPCGMS